MVRCSPRTVLNRHSPTDGGASNQAPGQARRKLHLPHGEVLAASAASFEPRTIGEANSTTPVFRAAIRKKLSNRAPTGPNAHGRELGQSRREVSMRRFPALHIRSAAHGSSHRRQSVVRGSPTHRRRIRSRRGARRAPHHEGSGVRGEGGGNNATTAWKAPIVDCVHRRRNATHSDPARRPTP